MKGEKPLNDERRELVQNLAKERGLNAAGPAGRWFRPVQHRRTGTIPVTPVLPPGWFPWRRSLARAAPGPPT